MGQNQMGVTLLTNFTGESNLKGPHVVHASNSVLFSWQCWESGLVCVLWIAVKNSHSLLKADWGHQFNPKWQLHPLVSKILVGTLFSGLCLTKHEWVLYYFCATRGWQRSLLVSHEIPRRCTAWSRTHTQKSLRPCHQVWQLCFVFSSDWMSQSTHGPNQMGFSCGVGGFLLWGCDRWVGVTDPERLPRWPVPPSDISSSITLPFTRSRPPLHPIGMYVFVWAGPLSFPHGELIIKMHMYVLSALGPFMFYAKSKLSEGQEQIAAV